MADPLSVSSSLLTLITFSHQASQSLYESIESFKSPPRAIREIRDEIKSLNGVLEMLLPMAVEHEDQLTHLRLPLLRCGKECRELEETINKSIPRAGVQRMSFRDWARLRYRGGDIEDFKNTLAGYKNTINIGISAVNLHHATVSNILAKYDELNSDISLHIQRLLHKTDHQYADSRELKEEREGTQRVLESITKTLHDIDNDLSRLEPRSWQEDELIEAGHFTALRSNVSKHRAFLESRLKILESKLNSLSVPNTAELEGNSKEGDIAQSPRIYDQLSNSVPFENVVVGKYSTQISDGVLARRIPKRRIFTRRITARHSTRSLIGEMSDEKLALLKREDASAIVDCENTLEGQTVVTEYDPSLTQQTKYDGGDISSINSDGDSMFSYGTEQTSATSVASDARDLLVKHFVDDHELKNLVVSALARMPSEKFMQNFRRLLKKFSKRLILSAKNTLEREAALMVRKQRFYLSRAVTQQLGGQFLDGQKQLKRRGKVEKWLSSLSEDISQSKGMSKELESEQSASEDSSDASGCEVNLKEVEYFILKTKAFKMLKLNLQSFISPSAKPSVMATEASPDEISEISAESPGVREITQKNGRLFSETKSDDKALMDEPPVLTPVRRRARSIGRSLVRLMYHPLNIFENFLRPEIPSGHLRVSWICECGKNVYIDVEKEYRTAAIKFAQQAAGTSNAHTIQVDSSPGNISSLTSTESSSSSSRHSSSSNDHISSTLPSTATSGNEELPGLIIPAGSKRYLLVCVKDPIGLIKLGHVDLTHVKHDEVLFRQVDAEYKKLRGKNLKNAFMIPTKIEYIKFQLILLRKSGECVANFETDSIPSEKHVLNGDYTFTPCPPQVGRLPIKSELLLHWLHDPGNHSGSLAVQALPKKLRTKLSCYNDQDKRPIGYAIYIVLGCNKLLVSILLLGAILATMILTLIWCILKGDVQTGTGMGQYLLGLLGLSFTALGLPWNK